MSNIRAARGPTSTIIFDIHALQERFYFGDSILLCFESGIPLLIERLNTLEDADNVVIAYPDEGTSASTPSPDTKVHRLHQREGTKRIVKLKEGEPIGRHVVIVDDLVQSGSTLIECQNYSTASAPPRFPPTPPTASSQRLWKRFTSTGAGGQGSKLLDHGLLSRPSRSSKASNSKTVLAVAIAEAPRCELLGLRPATGRCHIHAHTV